MLQVAEQGMSNGGQAKPVSLHGQESSEMNANCLAVCPDQMSHTATASAHHGHPLMLQAAGQGLSNGGQAEAFDLERCDSSAMQEDSLLYAQTNCHTQQQHQHGHALMLQAAGQLSNGGQAKPVDLERRESSEMDEDYQEASSEVEGMPPALYLLSDPTVAVNIPQTQVSILMKRSLWMSALDNQISIVLY